MLPGINGMKRLIYCVILLHGLFLGIFDPSGKSLANNVSDASIKSTAKSVNVSNTFVRARRRNLQEKPHTTNTSLPNWALSKVWVIDNEKRSENKPFMWVVKNHQMPGQQPFLQVDNKSGKIVATKKKPAKKAGLKPFDQVTKDTRKSSGLFTIYRHSKQNKIYLEIKPQQLNQNFLATATLESGIGEKGIYSGMPLENFLFYFKRVNNELHFVVRNVNFRTREDDPQVRSLTRSFSDSILYTIKIKSIHPQTKSLLIDLGDILLKDLAGLSQNLGSIGSAKASYFGKAKAFPQNIEIESISNFVAGKATKKRKFSTCKLSVDG